YQLFHFRARPHHDFSHDVEKFNHLFQAFFIACHRILPGEMPHYIFCHHLADDFHIAFFVSFKKTIDNLLVCCIHCSSNNNLTIMGFTWYTNAISFAEKSLLSNTYGSPISPAASGRISQSDNEYTGSFSEPSEKFLCECFSI